MNQSNFDEDRHIEIHGDAIRSTIFSGDGNKVFIHYHSEIQVQLEAAPSTPKLGPNPYRGLAAFQVEDAAVYFGREGQIDRLWNRLREFQERATQDKPSARLLPILGASGSGKSSLARAGLLPELAQRPLPGYQQTYVAVMKPGESPLEGLARVLARIATNDPSPSFKRAEFEASLRQSDQQGKTNSLRKIVNDIPCLESSPLVILIDQFEEVYSSCKDANERVIFIDNLIEAASSSEARVSVVITMRLDFVAETQRHPLLNKIIGSDQSVILPVMTPQELRRAIAEPAKQAGRPLDDSLIDRLVEQTEGREGALPLLQFALTQIWEGRKKGTSDSETLNAIGGVGGALAGKAQEIYDDLTDVQKVIARRIFLGLIQLREGTRNTRRQVALDRLRAQQDDEADFRTVLKRFSALEARLITLTAVSKETETAKITHAEVTHEALFEHWQQLKVWLDLSREDILLQRRLQDAAQHWDEQSRPEGLLWRPPDLDVLKSFHQRARDEMTSNEVEFFNASVEAIKRSEQARKRQRQRTIVGLTGGLVSALVLASIAGVGWLQATTAATNERIKALAAESESFFDLSGAASSLDRDDFLSESLSKQDEKFEKQQLETKEKFFPAALFKAIRAGRELQQAVFGVETETKFRVLGALRQAVYTQRKSTAFSLPECDPLKRGPLSIAWDTVLKTIACVNYDGTVRLWDGKTGRKINVFRGDSEWVNDVQFSPDGKLIASGAVDGTVKLWERSTGKESRSLKGNLSEVNCISFSPDSQIVVAGNYDGSVIFWEVATGRELRVVSGNRNSYYPGKSNYYNSKISTVHFSPNGQFLVSGDESGTLKLWEVATGKELKNLSDGASAVTRLSAKDIAFSLNSQIVTYPIRDSSIDIKLRFWNIAQNKELRTLPISGRWFLSPDGQTFAIFDNGYKSFTTGGQHERRNLVSLWDSLTGRKLKTLSNSSGDLGDGDEVDFSPDGNLIAIVTRNRKDNPTGLSGFKTVVTLWNRTGEQLKTFTQEGANVDFSFSPNGQKIAVSSLARSDNGFYTISKLWDVSTGRELKTLGDESLIVTPEESSVGVNSRFSPDGLMIAAIDSNGVAKFFDSSTGKELNLPNVNNSHNIARPPYIVVGGKRAVTLNTDGSMQNRSRFTDEEIKFKRWDHLLASDAHISDDDKTITTVNWYGKLQQRELATGKILNSTDLPFQNVVSALAFSPDAHRVAAAMPDETVKIWDTKTSREIISLKEYAYKPDEKYWLRNELYFSPDSKVIAALSGENTFEKGEKLELWEVPTGKAILFPENPSDVRSISFSPDNAQLAILKTDNTIQLWEISIRQLVRTIRPTLSDIRNIKFSENGTLLFVMGRDSTAIVGGEELKLWDVAADRAIASLKIPSGSLYSSSIGFVGKTLFVRDDNKFGLLNFDLEDLLKNGCDIARDYLKNNPKVNESDRHLCDFSPEH